MKKILLIIAANILFTATVFSQDFFGQKSAWGLTFGANYQYPLVKEYSVYQYFFSDYPGEVPIITYYYPQAQFGGYAGFSRYFKLYSDLKNYSFGLTTDLYYDRLNSAMKISSYYDLNFNNPWQVKQKYKTINTSLNILLTNVFNFQNKKYGLMTCFGLNNIYYNYGTDNFDPFVKFNLMFSLGFIFNFKNFCIIPCYNQPFLLLNRPGTKFDEKINGYSNQDYAIYQPNRFQQSELGLRIYYTIPDKNKSK